MINAARQPVSAGRHGAPVVLIALLMFGCDGDRRAPTAPPAPSPSPRPAPQAEEDRSYALPAAPRIVAIGDVHGDLAATRAALRLAGAIDDGDRWIGGNLVVVQTGDQLDRGDRERAILDLLERLTDEAKAAGGALHVLNGNHEIMNVQGDLRYVTEGGYKEFDGAPGLDQSHPAVSGLPPHARARAAAFKPGGPYARKMATRRVVVMVGDTVFAHAGVLPAYARYGIGRLNREVQAWMEGQSSSPPAPVTAEDGPVWTRRYGGSTLGPDDCEVLGRALEALRAKRMVVGHTVQKGGISSGCDGRVWRIDVGMAAHYGGKPEVLEIQGDSVRAMK